MKLKNKLISIHTPQTYDVNAFTELNTHQKKQYTQYLTNLYNDGKFDLLKEIIETTGFLTSMTTPRVKAYSRMLPNLVT